VKSKLDAPPPKRRKVSPLFGSDEDEEEDLKVNVKRNDARFLSSCSSSSSNPCLIADSRQRKAIQSSTSRQRRNAR
jgi:hypothetical protein